MNNDYWNKMIKRSDLRANPDTIFIFGDNLIEMGYGGQAAEMRDEPNAVGIPTKKLPSMSEDSFFTDDEYKQNIKAIDKAIAKIPKGKKVVVPPAGIGTGLAQLPQRAPRTYAYLKKRLDEICSTN
jgi:hypothetical protein